MQLGEGAGRDPGRVRRGRLARAARRGRLEELARDRRPPPRRGAHRRGARPRSTGSRSSASSSRARTAATASRAAAARRGKRLLQVGDRTGHAITKALREAFEAGGGTELPNHALRSLERSAAGWSATAAHVRRARSVDAGDGRPRRRRPLLPGGRGARRALHEPSGRDRRGDARSRSALGAEARDLDALQYHPNGGAWPAEHAGLLDSRDDARLRRRAPERRRRGVHRLARPARRRLAGDRRRGRGGQRRRDARRPAGGLPRHDADLRGRRRGLAAVHAAPLPRRRHRPAAPSRSSPTPSSTTRTAGS